MSQLEHSEVSREGKQFPLWLWAIHVEQSDNVGALFRLADALGIQKIYLVGETPHPPHRKISKVARQTERHVPWEYFSEELALEKLKEIQNSATSNQIIGLEITSKSIDLAQFQLRETTQEIHLLLGNEKRGIHSEFLSLCQSCVHIPMQGQNSSMNVSIAAGISAYQIIQKII